ncbi:MAG: hypothetical protein KDI46_04350 [Alphaproteobacteria bacterium]|nr:hypothetical protein [Alphaproteobacteria bacterium]
MLYISAHDPHGEPYLKFERELYYRNQKRECHKERQLYTKDIEILRRDDEWLKELGFGLILSLLIRKDLKDSKGRTWAQIPYPHHRGRTPVVRIDQEPYEYKKCRTFCTIMPLPSIDVDREIVNEELKRALALTVLEYLPLDVEDGESEADVVRGAG